VSPQAITIANGGDGTLSGLSATTSSPWLQASFVDALTTANPTATLRLQPVPGALGDGTYTGTVTVSSTLSGVAPRTIPVTFRLSAPPVAFKIEAVTSPTQAGSVGRPVAQPPTVVVRAADNTPVPGVAVSFSVNGGGTIVPSGVVTTDANGVAALASWTLGEQAGALQTVTVSAPGLAGSPLTFTATSLSASKIARVSGDAQSTVLGRPLPEPVVVRVTDAADTPVPNATVTFAAAAGSVTPTLATTDVNGLARATWTLGTTIGAQTLTATLVGPQGTPSVTFTATAMGATTISIVAGDNQDVPAGSEVPVPPRVRVTGVNGEPVVGVTVTFTPGAGGGSVVPTSAVTTPTGEASTRWTMPTSTGPTTLTASINLATGPASVTFAATVTPPAVSGIVIPDGDNQSGRVSSALPRQVVARVITTIGTAVPGVSVTFTPASGTGQSFSPASGVTDANGEVRTTWTLGPALGNYTAVVSAPGLSPRPIVATANRLAPDAGMFTGSAAKVPGGAVPTAGDQAVLVYSGPASGEVALGSGGSFATPVLPVGTYTLSVVSKAGAFPTTTIYGATLADGSVVSLGTIALAYPGTGSLQVAVHWCPAVGNANGTATVRLYNGINGDQGGSAAYTWTIPLGSVNTEPGVAYGIYTLTVTAQATDPTKSCAGYRTTLQHSFTTANGTTTIPLIVLNNP
jgi:adhesin/invasin